MKPITDIVRSLECSDLPNFELVDGMALLDPEQSPSAMIGEVVYPIVTSRNSALLQEEDNIVVCGEHEPPFDDHLINLPRKYLKHGQHLEITNAAICVNTLS